LRPTLPSRGCFAVGKSSGSIPNTLGALARALPTGRELSSFLAAYQSKCFSCCQSSRTASCLLLSAADNLESSGQADEASSLHPSTARSCVEGLGSQPIRPHSTRSRFSVNPGFGVSCCSDAVHTTKLRMPMLSGNIRIIDVSLRRGFNGGHPTHWHCLRMSVR
jgi:hypothetical protein